MTKIKICGLTRECDIEAVNEAAPDYVGFVFAKSRRRVTPAQAKNLRESLSGGIVPVGVFVNAEISEILALVRGGVIDAVQLHGSEDEKYIRALKEQLGAGVPVIKAVAVAKKGDAPAWEQSAADFLLLDKEGGGTGKVFDWNLIGGIKKPYFLAGGLSPENVAQAIAKLQPYAVDVSSGVEEAGLKSAEKIQEFMRRTQ